MRRTGSRPVVGKDAGDDCFADQCLETEAICAKYGMEIATKAQLQTWLLTNNPPATYGVTSTRCPTELAGEGFSGLGQNKCVGTDHWLEGYVVYILVLT